MPPVINRKKCVKCGHCVQICPLNVLYQAGPAEEVTVRYPDECWHCRACVIECGSGAVTMRYPLSHMVLHYPKNGGGEKA
ncbi:MAG: ferredoxin family protein [Oscillospiraceae bacterium]